jgi:Cu/Ag efflux protein CusF
MEIKIGRDLALAAIAASIAVYTPQVIAADDSTPSRISGGTVAESVSATATVEDIDLAKRMVTLKDEKGEVTELKVPEEVRNLAQVKKGDVVVATYQEAVGYEVFKAGTAVPEMKDAAVAERAKLGEKPAAGVADVESVTATIEAIDKAASKVTLKGPEGRKVTVKVKDPKKLEGVSVGDLVQLTYTRALAISVKPAAAK